MSWSNCGPFPLLVSLSPSLPHFDFVLTGSSRFKCPARYCTPARARSRCPLRRLSRRRRRRLRRARYSLSHSADGVSSALAEGPISMSNCIITTAVNMYYAVARRREEEAAVVVGQLQSMGCRAERSGGSRALVCMSHSSIPPPSTLSSPLLRSPSLSAFSFSPLSNATAWSASD